MKKVFFILLLASTLFSKTTALTYIGGKYSGTFKISGYGNTDSISDTITLDGILLLTNYYTHSQNTSQCGPFNSEYGLWINTQTGTIGMKTQSDTNWQSATSYPSSGLSLDTIPLSTNPPNKNLGTNPRGIRIGMQSIDGECSNTAFSLSAGYKRVIYLHYSRFPQDLYGKMEAYKTEVSVGNTFPANIKLVDLIISYTFSNSVDLNDGAVPVAPPKGNKIHATGERFFDIVGRSYNGGIRKVLQLIGIPVHPN